jgi:dCMP deaminase
MKAERKNKHTCIRRKVGAILVDRNGYICGTGYNGVAAGQTHCIDTPCPGAPYSSGVSLEVCEAIHAEQNALLQCKDKDNIFACYSTVEPCITCTKLLMNTTCTKIIFNERYKGKTGRNLWYQSRGPMNWVDVNTLYFMDI